MTTRAIFFPFDLFGNPGARAGAELLADAFQEMLADNKRERVPTRARAYAGKIRFEQMTLETIAEYQSWRANARTVLHEIVRKNDFLLWVSGNHLGVLPVYEELAPTTLVVQLDAHLDIYHLSDCTTELSHGNFLMHAASLPPIVNLGHRELLLKPDHIARYYEAAYSSADLTLDENGVLHKLQDRCASAGRIHLDIDCDVFDPAYFPAVAQPRPFGMNPLLVLRLLDVIGAARLTGLSISEFDPSRDERDRSLETLMWLIEYVLLRRYEPARRA